MRRVHLHTDFLSTFGDPSAPLHSPGATWKQRLGWAIAGIGLSIAGGPPSIKNAGRSVLRHIMRVSFIGRTTFDERGNQSLMLVREGKRQLALDIFKFLHRDHASLMKAMENGMEQGEL